MKAEKREKPGIFFGKTVNSHTALLAGQACCPADAHPVLLTFVSSGGNPLTSAGGKARGIPDANHGLGQFSWWAACCAPLTASRQAVRNLL